MAGRVARDQTTWGLGPCVLPLGALVGLLIVALGLAVVVDGSGATKLPWRLARSTSAAMACAWASR